MPGAARGWRGRYIRKDRIPGVIKQVTEETVGEVEEVLDVTFLSFKYYVIFNTIFDEYYVLISPILLFLNSYKDLNPVDTP